MDWNIHLTQVAQRYLEQAEFPDLHYATLSGSVARGEADDFSDIDMHVYTKNINIPATQTHQVCTGEILQVLVTPLPTYEMIQENFWQWRFLQQEVPLLDTHGSFTQLKRQLIQDLATPHGIQQVTQQVRRLLDERLAWVERSTQAEQGYTATIAAMAAWIDAAFFYAYAAQHLFSTSDLLPFLERSSGLFGKLQQNWSLPTFLSAEEIYIQLRRLERYRAYMSSTAANPASFMLSPLQDILCGRKAKRALRIEEYLPISLELYSDAFFLYLDTAGTDTSFDEHLTTLPTQLQEDLHKLGLQNLPSQKVKALCELCEAFFTAAIRILEAIQKA